MHSTIFFEFFCMIVRVMKEIRQTVCLFFKNLSFRGLLFFSEYVIILQGKQFA